MYLAQFQHILTFSGVLRPCKSKESILSFTGGNARELFIVLDSHVTDQLVVLDSPLNSPVRLHLHL